MDQINHLATVIGALSASKLPTNAQITSSIDWLLYSDTDILKIDDAKTGAKPSIKTQNVIRDIRDLLEIWKDILKEKNEGEWMQELLYELGQTDLANIVKGKTPPLDTSLEAVSDATHLINSIFIIFVVVLENISPEAFALLIDYKNLGLDFTTDSLEVVEESARKAKMSIRRTDSRDNTGEDIIQETVEFKNKGIANLGLLNQNASDFALFRMKKVALRARDDEAFRRNVHGCLDLFGKWVKGNVDHEDGSGKFTFDSIDDPDGHLKLALKAVDNLFIQFNDGTSLLSLVKKVQHLLGHFHEHSELMEFYSEVDVYIRKNVDDYEYAKSDQSVEDGNNLLRKWDEMTEETSDDVQESSSSSGASRNWKSDARILKNELTRLSNRVSQDPLLNKLIEAHRKLGKDLIAYEQVTETSSTKSKNIAEIYGDILDVLIPRISALLHNVPVPRTEYRDPDIEFVMSNVNLQSLTLFPGSIKISQTVDVEMSKESTSGTSSQTIKSYGILTIRGAHVDAKDISFWLRIPKAYFMKEDQGLVDLKLDKGGFNATIKYTIAEESETKGRQTFYDIEDVKVDLSGLDLVIKESTHNFLLWLLKLFRNPIKSRVRKALEISLQSSLHSALEVMDNFAWDVTERIGIFHKTGYSIPASVLAGLFSGMGKVAKKPSVPKGVQITSVGVIRKDPSRDSQFAIGTKPQIFSEGDHSLLPPVSSLGNPLSFISSIGGQSESGEKEVEIPEDPDAGTTADPAVKVTKENLNAVVTFKDKVLERKEIEQAKEGWKSDAFDI